MNGPRHSPGWKPFMKNKQNLIIAGVIVVVLTVAALILSWMGHPWTCTCGVVKIWGGIQGAESSQHIFDYYTYSHVIHGFIFYFVLWLVAHRLPAKYRLLIAVMIEVAWELFENSSFIINRYRQSTISYDYFGDSIINSLSDIVAMMAGFWWARKFPVWVTIALVVILETVVGVLIHDNLTLNIIMLIHPFESIKAWQAM